ncbi:MAG: exodeoxyribonuclease VII small subunit [Bacteroidota bacterium]
MSNPPSYEAALQELETILQDLQGEQTSIDELTARSERAAELIAYCREKLRSTEAKLLPKVEKPDPST